MLYSVLIIFDVLLAIAMVVFILLQQGKGANAGAAFGSGASATVFGSRGSASFLSRTTAVLATLFFMNSLGLAHLASNQPAPKSVIERMGIEQGTTGGSPSILPQADPQEVPPENVSKPEDLPE